MKVANTQLTSVCLPVQSVDQSVTVMSQRGKTVTEREQLKIYHCVQPSAMTLQQILNRCE